MQPGGERDGFHTSKNKRQQKKEEESVCLPEQAADDSLFSGQTEDQLALIASFFAL